MFLGLFYFVTLMIYDIRDMVAKCVCMHCQLHTIYTHIAVVQGATKVYIYLYILLHCLKMSTILQSYFTCISLNDQTCLHLCLFLWVKKLKSLVLFNTSRL